MSFLKNHFYSLLLENPLTHEVSLSTLYFDKEGVCFHDVEEAFPDKIIFSVNKEKDGNLQKEAVAFSSLKREFILSKGNTVMLVLENDITDKSHSNFKLNIDLDNVTHRYLEAVLKQRIHYIVKINLKAHLNLSKLLEEKEISLNAEFVLCNNCENFFSEFDLALVKDGEEYVSSCPECLTDAFLHNVHI